MLMRPGWRRVPLWGHWDNRTPLANPHKGWYLHYFDNCITQYLDKEHPDDYLEDFPCMNHVYLRLAWSYLEPEEGKFNWELVDEVIRRWWAHDRRVSFRISCKETGADQAYATPKWVFDAGCRGELTGAHGAEKVAWEPDYGDPIFLEKFGNFMKAFGKRYNGAPFLEFVDIGSFGEWGEGHTEGTSERTWPLEVMKEHIDLHVDNFPDTYVVFNYDMAAVRRTYDGTEEELLNYAVRRGCGVRADSACVGFYEDRYGLSSMHIPEYFQRFIGVGPMDLEFGHYGHVKKENAWNHGFTGLAAILETRSTFAGFHGYAREFLADEPAAALSMGNVLGYWYFPSAAYLPDKVRAGERAAIGLTWENRGSSAAYWPFKLYMKLTPKAGGDAMILPLREADNRLWEPLKQYDEVYSFRPCKDAMPGAYELSVGLFEQECENAKQVPGISAPPAHPFPGRPILLGLAQKIRDAQGFYRLGELEIAPYQDIPYEGVVSVESLWPEHPKHA